MQTFAPALLGSRRPRVRSHPPYTETYGPEAVELAASAGLIADPWQSDVLDVMLAYGHGGRWTCPECGLVVPRQNGKGSVYEIRALAGLYLLSEKLVMWSAHEYKTAMEGFRRVLGLIDGTDDLRRRVFKVSNTNGDEGIELHGEGRSRITGRQRLRFIARSKGSGRGFSGDCNLLDEVFALTEEQVAALMPTVSARPNAQLVYASSPPLDAATGEPLFALKGRGEAGTDPGLAWFDWGQERGVDLDDPAVWAAANPALGIRISTQTVERERRSMTAEAFGRERLGIWPEKAGDSVISMRRWSELADPSSRRDGDVAFALDVEPNRGHASIQVYGLRADGLGHLELVDRRPGTAWVPARLAELKERHNPIGIGLDGAGPAASLRADLKTVGIEPPDDPDSPARGDLTLLGARDVAAACGQILDAITNGTLRHIDQPDLNAAVDGVKLRPLGDASAFARRRATGDISPLVAGSFARYVFVTLLDKVTEEADPGAWYV